MIGGKIVQYAARKGMQALRNPRVQGYVRQTAKNMGLRTLARVNRRRQARGRRVFVPASRWQNKTQTRQITAPPVRVNTVQQSRTRNEIVSAEEASNLTVLGYTDDVHEPYWVRVTPNDEQLWPALSAKANLYTEYSCNGMEVTFTPSVPSTFKGSMVLAWASNPQNDNSDFDNSTMLRSLPDVTCGSVAQTLSLSIPLDSMCGSGQNRFMPRSDVTVQDMTNYYLGNLFWLPFNCEDDTTPLGTFSTRYVFSLKKQRPDFNANASAIMEGVVEHAGFAHPTVTELSATELAFWYTTMKPVTMIVKTTSQVGFAAVDSAPLTPAFTATNGTRSIFVYEMGRKVGQVNLTLTITTGTIDTVALVSLPPNVLSYD